MQMESDNRYQNAFNYFMEVFITPEVIRRQEKAVLSRPLDFRAAQIIFYSDSKKPEIRINAEVKAIGELKLKEGVTKEAGEPVYESEVEGFENLMLTEDESPDCGHATFIKLGEHWIMVFDFIYNKGLASKHIDAAKEFIEAAEFAFIRSHWSAFVDNAFSAAELLAKATLLLYWSEPTFIKKTNHRAIISRYNRYAYLGNTSVEHAEVLNRLSHLRYPARYMDGKLSLTEVDAGWFIEVLKEMLREAEAVVRKEKSMIKS